MRRRRAVSRDRLFPEARARNTASSPCRAHMATLLVEISTWRSTWVAWAMWRLSAAKASAAQTSPSAMFGLAVSRVLG